MERLISFVGMGGYAHYIWPAFGVTVLVLAVLALASLRSLRARERMLALMQVSDDAQRGARRRKGAA